MKARNLVQHEIEHDLIGLTDLIRKLQHLANGGGGGTTVGSSTYVTSITGTINQVVASASTGAVTLSLPQSINTTSSPTFANETITTLLTVPTIQGSTASAGNLILQSTSHGTKGKVYFGPIANANYYEETTGIFNIGNTSTTSKFFVYNSTAGLWGTRISADVGWSGTETVRAGFRVDSNVTFTSTSTIFPVATEFYPKVTFGSSGSYGGFMVSFLLGPTFQFNNTSGTASYGTRCLDISPTINVTQAGGTGTVGTLTYIHIRTPGLSITGAYNVTTSYGMFVEAFAKATTGYGVFFQADTANTGTSKYKIYVSNVSGNATNNYSIYTNAGDVSLMAAGTDKIGFHGAAPIAQQTVSGSRGANAALASLITALANVGIIVDGSSA